MRRRGALSCLPLPSATCRLHSSHILSLLPSSYLCCAVTSPPSLLVLRDMYPKHAVPPSVPTTLDTPHTPLHTQPHTLPAHVLSSIAVCMPLRSHRVCAFERTHVELYR